MTQFYMVCEQVTAWEAQQKSKDTNILEDGYYVKRADGTISWLAKAVFEAGYLPMGNDPTRLNQDTIDNFIKKTDSLKVGKHTVLYTELKNGFSIVTDSACVSLENYNHEIGTNLALAKAKSKIWELLGFLLSTSRFGVNIKTGTPK